MTKNIPLLQSEQRVVFCPTARYFSCAGKCNSLTHVFCKTIRMRKKIYAKIYPFFHKKFGGASTPPNNHASGLSISVFSFFHFFRSNRLPVDGTPCIYDIGQNERNQNGNISHRLERELAGTAVGDGQRALQVSG